MKIKIAPHELYELAERYADEIARLKKDRDRYKKAFEDVNKTLTSVTEDTKDAKRKRDFLGH